MGSANLVSKIAAGGLSAGIFLIWWPGHVDGDGLGHFIVRGLLWTLAFELLLLAFAPLERLVVRAVKERFDPRFRPPAPKRGGAVVLASVGLVVPLLMLADPGTPQAGEPAPKAKPRVIKQVIVKRPVIRREVVVKPEVVTQTAPAPPPKTRTIVKRERVVVERTKVVEKKVPVAAEVEPVKETEPAPTAPEAP